MNENQRLEALVKQAENEHKLTQGKLIKESEKQQARMQTIVEQHLQTILVKESLIEALKIEKDNFANQTKEAKQHMELK